MAVESLVNLGPKYGRHPFEKEKCYTLSPVNLFVLDFVKLRKEQSILIMDFSF